MIYSGCVGMSSERPKQILYEQFAEVAKGVAHGHRLEILELLAQGELSVEVLAERAGLSIANASQHLRLMRRVGERNVAAVRDVIGGYFHRRDAFEPVSRKELARRLKDGLVTVLDVRPRDEFGAGHLPNAINIPLRELPTRLRDIPKTREVVAYCRGPYCVLAFEAVALLRERGFKVRRLEDGYPEWKAAGLPVEASPAST